MITTRLPPVASPSSPKKGRATSSASSIGPWRSSTASPSSTTSSARASHDISLERTRWLRRTSFTGLAPRCMSEITTVSTPTIFAARDRRLPCNFGELALLPPQSLHRRLPYLLQGHGARSGQAGPAPARRPLVRRRRQAGRLGGGLAGGHRSVRIGRSVRGRGRRQLRH